MFNGLNEGNQLKNYLVRCLKYLKCQNGQTVSMGPTDEYDGLKLKL